MDWKDMDLSKITPEDVARMLDEREGGRTAGRGDSPFTQERYEEIYGLSGGPCSNMRGVGPSPHPDSVVSYDGRTIRHNRRSCRIDSISYTVNANFILEIHQVNVHFEGGPSIEGCKVRPDY